MYNVMGNVVSKQVENQTNIITRMWNRIDWDTLLTNFITTLIYFILLSILFWFLNQLGKTVIKKSILLPKNKKFWSESQAQTIYTLFNNIFHYIILFFYIYAVLSLVGVPVSTLIASAGIASVALGLGAQGFVKDIVNGSFILLEKQFAVGDTIRIGDIEGTVTAVGLRTTQVTSYDGTLNFIPNSQIQTVSNLSRNDMRALVDIQVLPNQDVDKIIQLIKQVNEELLPAYQSDIAKEPDVLGLMNDDNNHLVIRTIIFTKNGAQYKVERDFRLAYIERLKQNNIYVPDGSVIIREHKQ